MRTSRILCAGESLIDRIHSTDVTDHVGGSILNVAVGLARLGVRATLASSWGDDDPGRMIESVLAEAGVEIGHNACLSSTNIAHAYLTHGLASYDFELTNIIAEPEESSFDHLHIGSIGAFLDPGRTTSHALAERAHSHGATVSYDINVRPSLMGDPESARPLIEHTVELATIVKASDEDLAWLYPGLSVDEVCEQWCSKGPTLTIITRGVAGAYASCPTWSEPISLPVAKVDVVDTVGAGDSFTAGFLAQLAHDDHIGDNFTAERDRLTQAIAYGLATAGVTVTHSGAYAPTPDQLTA